MDEIEKLKQQLAEAQAALEMESKHCHWHEKFKASEQREKRLREALERMHAATNVIRADLGTKFPALAEAQVLATATLADQKEG